MKDYIDDDGEFGSRIKFARKIKGMSQIELAAKVGISQQGIQRLEVGKVKSTRMLVQIAYFLGVNLRWLAFGESGAPVDPKIRTNFFWCDLLKLPIFSWEDSAEIRALLLDKKELFHFSLRVRDNSMLNSEDHKINFFPNEQLFFCNKFYLNPDDFVIAAVPFSSCLTFRQYVPNGDHYILKARNPRYKSVPVTDDVLILGKLVHRYTDFNIVKW